MGKKNASVSASAPGSSPAPMPTPGPAPVTIPGSKGASVSSIKTEQGSLASDPLPNVKVNSAHLQEIKSALDDAVKKYLESLSFTPSLLHPTVHLSLGYTSIALAIGSYLYSLKVEFESSKPALWIGVGGYFLLQGLLWCWKRWVEGGQVFSGKRRRMVNRIETDIVQISSSTTLEPPQKPSITFSPHTRPSSPTSSPSSPASSSSHILPPPQHPVPAEIVPTFTSKQYTEGPTYLLNLTFSTTANNGKSLLHKARIASGRYVGEFVDVDGGVEEGEVARWVGGLLADAGLAGADDEGMKNE